MVRLSPTRFSVGMVHPSAFLRIVGYALFSIPPFLLLIYLVTQFPKPQESLHIYPSLASVPRSNRVWEIYDEDYFPGGGYAALPYGRVSSNSGLPVPHTHELIRYDTGSWVQRKGRRWTVEITLWTFSDSVPPGRSDPWVTPPVHYLEECGPRACLSWVPGPVVWYVNPTQLQRLPRK